MLICYASDIRFKEISLNKKTHCIFWYYKHLLFKKKRNKQTPKLLNYSVEVRKNTHATLSRKLTKTANHTLLQNYLRRSSIQLHILENPMLRSKHKGLVWKIKICDNTQAKTNIGKSRKSRWRQDHTMLWDHLLIQPEKHKHATVNWSLLRLDLIGFQEVSIHFHYPFHK